MTIAEANVQLNIEVDLLDEDASNRPGTRIDVTHITIHNTANKSKGANARMHARYMKGADARARKVSWHYTVDEERVIKHLPYTEKAWHAGRGNACSIGIELCENLDGDWKATQERAALLVAILMKSLNIPLRNVVPHKYWTGKHCPRVILGQNGGFAAFRLLCEAAYSRLT